MIPEHDLWLRWKEQQDEAAREDLIVRHIQIVKYIAGRMAMKTPASIDFDDLLGWGMLGLMDAVDKFDHTQNIKFSTYASIRVRGAILDEIRSMDWAPRSLRAMARKVADTREKLQHEGGHEPTPDAIAAELGTTAEHVEETLAQLQTAQILSLDDFLPAEEGAEARKLDLIAAPEGANPESAAMDQERQEILVKAILELPDQQQKVLNLYYFEQLTLKEIGAVLDVSESRVCQVHSAAIKRLRKVMQGES